MSVSSETITLPSSLNLYTFNDIKPTNETVSETAATKSNRKISMLATSLIALVGTAVVSGAGAAICFSVGLPVIAAAVLAAISAIAVAAAVVIACVMIGRAIHGAVKNPKNIKPEDTNNINTHASDSEGSKIKKLPTETVHGGEEAETGTLFDGDSDSDVDSID